MTADRPDPMELLGELMDSSRRITSIYPGCDHRIIDSAIWEKVAPALRAAIEAREVETLKVASLYGSALIALGDAGTFLMRAKEKAFDRFGGCIYCGLHKEKGHAEDCQLTRFEKVIRQQKTNLYEACTPTSKGG